MILLRKSYLQCLNYYHVDLNFLKNYFIVKSKTSYFVFLLSWFTFLNISMFQLDYHNDHLSQLYLDLLVSKYYEACLWCLKYILLCFIHCGSLIFQISLLNIHHCILRRRELHFGQLAEVFNLIFRILFFWRLRKASMGFWY